MLLVPFSILAYQSPGSPRGAVNDFAGMLTPSEVEGLSAKLSDFEKQTGNAIVIATVNDLGGDTAENFAVQLFKEWGIGQKDKDNGVLILVSKEDRAMKIEVGYGLEGALTDAQSFWIIRDVMTPAFQNGDYSGGLNGAVDKIIAATQGEVIPSADMTSEGQTGGFLYVLSKFFWFFIFVLIWLGSVLARSKSWWAGGVIGAVIGIIIGFAYGFLYNGLIAIVGLGVLGLAFDYLVSKAHENHKKGGNVPPWWLGGGGMGGWGGGHSGGFGGGGFGGFGGGSSGGGGASGRW